MRFPTTPGSSFEYRGETYWVIEAKGKTVIAETSYGKKERFYN